MNRVAGSRPGRIGYADKLFIRVMKSLTPLGVRAYFDILPSLRKKFYFITKVFLLKKFSMLQSVCRCILGVVRAMFTEDFGSHRSGVTSCGSVYWSRLSSICKWYVGIRGVLCC